LPTEAEWEYACRAGTKTAFFFGDTFNGEQANFDVDYPFDATKRKGPLLQRTCAVGLYRPNSWDLYDVHGNVWQWCQDWYGPYDDLGKKDPLRIDKIKGKEYRVMRGGSYRYPARNCRAANRAYCAPGYRDRDVGFRVAFRLD
jgi:formylglycine-generating enzyme required for sulfatase activity